MGEVDARQNRRLDRIEQITRATLPQVDPATGALQRLLLYVPSAVTRLALGARGGGPGAQPPIGPPGIAMTTDANLAAQIDGDTVVDTDGNMILHAVGDGRLLSQAPIGLASNSSAHIAATQDVEITAGGGAFQDPAYNRQESVPSPPAVDTASPRAGAEADRERLATLWELLDIGDAARTLMGFRSSYTKGVGSGGGFMPLVNSFLSNVRAGETLAMSAIGAALAALEQFEVESPVSDAPQLKLHGRGGVAVTSPAKISVHAMNVGVTGALKVSIKSQWSSSVKSLGNAKLYGVVGASVKSEGVTSVQGRFLSVKAGRMAELDAGHTLTLGGKEIVGLKSDGRVSVDAPEVAVVGSQTASVDSEGKTHVRGRDHALISSVQKVEGKVSDSQAVEITTAHVRALAGTSEVKLDGDGVKLAQRGGPEVLVSASAVQMGRRVRITDSEITIGPVRIST